MKGFSFLLTERNVLSMWKKRCVLDCIGGERIVEITGIGNRQWRFSFFCDIRRITKSKEC
jgi:hypothetical protein